MQASDEDVELHRMNNAAAAAEPLISRDRGVPNDARDRYDENDDESIREDDVDESALVSPGLFIWCLTICAGVSGLLFGYEYVPFLAAILCVEFPDIYIAIEAAPY
jgi:hypothetical protein